jgi:hypothetical protein
LIIKGFIILLFSLVKRSRYSGTKILRDINGEETKKNLGIPSQMVPIDPIQIRIRFAEIYNVK